MTVHAGRIFLGLWAIVASSAIAAEYRPPEHWKGKDGELTNNPALVSERPIWRAEALVGDNPLQVDAYEAVPWNASQKRWVGRAGGAAVIPVEGALRLGATRSKAIQQPASGALAFIAPASGRYTVRATVETLPWKQAPNQLAQRLVLVHRKADKTAVEVASWPLKEQAEDIEAAVDVVEGEELVFVCQGIKGNTGSNTALKNLRVEGP